MVWRGGAVTRGCGRSGPGHADPAQTSGVYLMAGWRIRARIGPRLSCRAATLVAAWRGAFALKDADPALRAWPALCCSRRRQAREVKMIPPTFAKPATATHEVIEMECAALVRWGWRSERVHRYLRTDVSTLTGTGTPTGWSSSLGRVLSRTPWPGAVRSVRADQSVSSGCGRRGRPHIQLLSYAEQAEPSRWNCTEVYVARVRSGRSSRLIGPTPSPGGADISVTR